MKTEIIKPIIKVGNSAGIILPKSMVGGKARVEIIENPINIKEDIIKILEDQLQNIKGIYLTGSHARNEQTEKSDIDIIAITNDINKKIEKGKYNILLLSEKSLSDTLEKNILPLLPMIKEAKTLINSSLLEKYQKTKITKKNIKAYLEITESALEINRSFIELEEKNVSDSIAYSLIISLRSADIIDCLKTNKKWTNKDLKMLIKKISGSTNSYESYLRIKNNLNTKKEIPLEEAKSLYKYLENKTKEHKEWAKKIN